MTTHREPDVRAEQVRTGRGGAARRPRRRERRAQAGTVTRLPGNRQGVRKTRRTTWPRTYNGYCVKCKEKRDFEGEVEVSDSGRRMAKGKCPVCGTTMNRILGKA